jgi:AcrR family transcriptional regulator
LTTAANLFARFGYSGVSTRDIAVTAEVNEVTIYRHFRRKRDLYCAVLEREFSKLQLSGDLLASLAEAQDGRTAIDRTFKLISTLLRRDPNLIRLVHFCALELDEDVTLLLRKHFTQLIEVIAGYLDRWIACGELPATNSRALVVSMAVIVCSGTSFARMFADEMKHQQQIVGDYAWYFSIRLPERAGKGVRNN